MSNDTYVLLWSKKSNCFHIELLHDTVAKGLRFFRAQQTNDYLVIGIGTHDECSAKADELRPTLTERDAVRRLYEAE